MTRIDAVDEELLDLAARAGCVQIDYGVESGNPDTLKRIHKPHTVEMVRRVIPLTRRHGIRPVVFFILGFPWEDAAGDRRDAELMRDLSPYVVFHAGHRLDPDSVPRHGDLRPLQGRVRFRPDGG